MRSQSFVAGWIQRRTARCETSSITASPQSAAILERSSTPSTWLDCASLIRVIRGSALCGQRLTTVSSGCSRTHLGEGRKPVMLVGPPEDRGRYQVDPGNVGAALSGAEGTVYRGIRAVDGAVVALKCLVSVRPDELPSVWNRLRVVGRVRHRALMGLVEAFVGCALTEDPDGLEPDDFDVCWLVSEWIPYSLEEERGARDVAWRLYAAADLADGVAALHEERSLTGLGRVSALHRDIKPSNVRVREDGSVALVDFGLAGPADDAKHGVGTRGWQAPEQALGGPATLASDVWAVGAVAYFVLTGNRPGDPREERHGLSDALRHHPNHKALAAVVFEPLEREPRLRPTDLGSWAARIRQATLAGEPRRVTGAKFVAAGVAGALLLVAGLITVSSFRQAPHVEELGQCELPPIPPTRAGQKVKAAIAQISDACVGEIYAAQDLIGAQLLDWERNPLDGVVVATSDSGPFRFTQAQWSGYVDIGGNLPTTIGLAGYPVKMTHLSDPSRWEIALSFSGVIVGRFADTIHFWVPNQVRALWDEAGGPGGSLGFPTSQTRVVNGRLTLDFEHGYMATAVIQLTPEPLPREAVDVVYVSSEVAREGIAKLGDVRGRILQQAAGPGWVVDERGRRRWINWGGMFACMGDWPNVVSRNVRGYEVASLPLGPIADCPLTATAERDPGAE